MVENSIWIPVGVLALLACVVLFNRMAEWRLKQKLAQAWEGAPFFIKKDTEESLMEALLLEAKRQPYDSQVDGQTWHDLKLDAVFDQLNYTQSSLGAEALYQRMRLLKFQDHERLHQLEAYFEAHPKERLEVQVILNQLGKKNHNQARALVASPSQHAPYLGLFVFLALLPILSLFLILWMPIVAISLSIASLVFNIIFSSLRNWSNKIRLDNVSYLVRIFASAERLSHLSVPGQESLKKAVKPFKIAKHFAGVLQSPTGNSEMEILLLYLNVLFLLPQIAQVTIYNKIRAYQAEAQVILDLLGEMEVAISLLRYKKELEIYCKPTFTNENGIQGQTLYHPLLDQPVANDVHFAKNMVISGDNASGKSTYLKMVAINAIVAQGLGFAYGESLSLPHGHVMTAMDVSDDIEVGDSYFITESKAILRMMESLGQSGFHYFFIDELFKGTNTIERIGAGLGIVRWLVARDCLYMISSHDIELVAASGKVNDNYHFDSRYVDGKIVFDYQIKPGSAVTKNAVHTLESLAYPEEITETARELIERYEASGQWSLRPIERMEG